MVFLESEKFCKWPQAGKLTYHSDQTSRSTLKVEVYWSESESENPVQTYNSQS